MRKSSCARNRDRDATRTMALTSQSQRCLGRRWPITRISRHTRINKSLLDHADPLAIINPLVINKAKTRRQFWLAVIHQQLFAIVRSVSGTSRTNATALIFALTRRLVSLLSTKWRRILVSKVYRNLSQWLTKSDPRIPPTHWTFRTETGPGGDQISYSGEMYNFAELDCGTDQDIMEACGPKGLKTREKRHYFCANGNFWYSLLYWQVYIKASGSRAPTIMPSATVRRTKRQRRARTSITRWVNKTYEYVVLHFE